MKVSTEIDNNFGYEKITQLVENIFLGLFCLSGIESKQVVYHLFMSVLS